MVILSHLKRGEVWFLLDNEVIQAVTDGNFSTKFGENQLETKRYIYTVYFKNSFEKQLQMSSGGTIIETHFIVAGRRFYRAYAQLNSSLFLRKSAKHSIYWVNYPRV